MKITSSIDDRLVRRRRRGPSLAEQVSRLYDLIAGYHLTNLIEVAREVGVWERITAQPGIASAALADALGTDPYYTDVLCHTAFAFELLEREGDGWRMARPHGRHPRRPRIAPSTWGGRRRST